MLWEIISWIIIGLVAGSIAKWIRPGKQGGGFWNTTIIGIAGALVGGFLAGWVGLKPVDANALNIWSILVAIGGAVIVLWIYEVGIRKRK